MEVWKRKQVTSYHLEPFWVGFKSSPDDFNIQFPLLLFENRLGDFELISGFNNTPWHYPIGWEWSGRYKLRTVKNGTNIK